MGLGISQWRLDSVNPLCLMINRFDGIVEEKNGDKYLNISDTDKNSDLLNKYLQVWDGIKDCIKK